MSRVHHRNLVSLVGYCQEGANQILVYEFIELGSLQDHLFGISLLTILSLNLFGNCFLYLRIMLVL